VSVLWGLDGIEGAARVAARHGRRKPSFETAAEAYTETVGWSISGSIVRASYPDEVHQAPGYFRNNCERMRYDEFKISASPTGR